MLAPVLSISEPKRLTIGKLMLWDRCHWCWTYVLHTTVGEVSLTLVLMVIYITITTCDPTDIDRTLNEAPTDKIVQYRVDYNNRPSDTIFFIPDISSTTSIR